MAWKVVQLDWIYLEAYIVSHLIEAQKLVKKNSIFYTSVIWTVVTVKYHTCYILLVLFISWYWIVNCERQDLQYSWPLPSLHFTVSFLEAVSLNDTGPSGNGSQFGITHPFSTLSFIFILFCKLKHIVYPETFYDHPDQVRISWSTFSFSLFKKLTLLGWHGLKKLYKFQVFSSITHHLYIALCAHHPKSHLPSPCRWPFLPFPISHTPFSSGNQHTIVCVYEYVCLFVAFSFISHLSEIIQSLTFSVWLTLHS